MSTLGLETTLASGVADGVDLAIVTGVLETTLSFDTVSLECLSGFYKYVFFLCIIVVYGKSH